MRYGIYQGFYLWWLKMNYTLKGFNGFWDIISICEILEGIVIRKLGRRFVWLLLKGTDILKKVTVDPIPPITHLRQKKKSKSLQNSIYRDLTLVQ